MQKFPWGDWQLHQSTLIPDPKTEINNRIKSYVRERNKRFFRADNNRREDFLTTIQTEITNPNADIRGLIDRVSRQVFFKNDWIDWICRREGQGTSLSEQNESLDYSNPFIQGLEIYQTEPQPAAALDQTRYTFNNPFFTAPFHYSLNQTLEDVLLLLMRLHVTQLSHNTTATIGTRVITNISSSGSAAFQNHITRLASQLRSLDSRRVEEADRQHRMAEMMPQSGA